MKLLILETPKARTVTLDGKLIAGPGGEGPVVAEFDTTWERVTEALGLQPNLFGGTR